MSLRMLLPLILLLCACGSDDPKPSAAQEPDAGTSTDSAPLDASSVDGDAPASTTVLSVGEVSLSWSNESATLSLEQSGEPRLHIGREDWVLGTVTAIEINGEDMPLWPR